MSDLPSPTASAQARLHTLSLQLSPTVAAGGAAASSAFDNVEQAPPDPILGVSEAYARAAEPKLNLGVGAYRTEEGKPLVLSAVRKAEARLAADASANHEYLPIGGIPAFCTAAAALAFGADAACLREHRAATLQSLSGTGALALGAALLARHYKASRTVLVPSPTWANHHGVFGAAGLCVRTYRYYRPSDRGLDYEGLIADLRAAERGAIVLLHACAHNPTGVDPSPEQWRGILAAVRERGLLPFFDSAYQGFASGDLDADAASLRLFAAARRADGGPLELLLAQSFAKNMGLYGERVGALTIVTASPAVRARVESQAKICARVLYSSPPAYGARLATMVLSDPALNAEWRAELQTMAGRIKEMRAALLAALADEGAPGSWGHIAAQVGMFSYSGLTKQQVEHVRDKWSVFMTLDGRISMAGVSRANVRHLAKAIADAVRSCP